MRSTKHDGPPDERVGGGVWRKTKVQHLWEQFQQKLREIRLLENELARTEHDELVEESDPTIPR